MNWENDFPPDFPIEQVSRRAQAEGTARRQRRRARQRSLTGLSLVVLLAAAGLTAVLARDENGSRLTAGPAPTAPVPARAANGKIAFVRSTGPEDRAPKLFVMNPDGTGQTFVRDLPAISALAWSPDGRKLVFGYGNDIAVMNADGSELTKLTTDGQWPSWSPDGSRIVFRSLRSGMVSSLWIMNADGSGLEQLSTGTFDSHPAWSPDGTRIAYAGDGKGGSDISIFTLDGSAKPKVLAMEGFEDSPTWSPDGARIAFRHDNDISVVNADGSAPAKPIATPPHTAMITPPGGGTPTSPSWSPDGSKIAYALLAAADRCSIWTMNPDGTGQTQLTDGTSCDRDVAWQPVPGT